MKACYSKHRKVAILGGGISGLTIARELHQIGIDVEVFESNNSIGGLARSKMINGYTYDISGGHIIFSKEEQILQYILAILGDNYYKIKREARYYWRGQFFRYPIENGLIDMPLSMRYQFLKDYIEAFYSRKFNKAQCEKPKNFQEWLIWRFGLSLAKDFLIPYNKKIWKTDLRSIGLSWIKGRIPDPPLDEILRSALGDFRNGYTHQEIFYYPKKGGIQAIPDGLAKLINNNIRLGNSVQNVEKTDNGFRVNDQKFDMIINTIPPQAFIKIYAGATKEIMAASEDLDYLSIMTVLLGLSKNNENDFSWVYFPNQQEILAHRITYLSNYSPYNVPSGKASILAEISYKGKDPLAEIVIPKLINQMQNCGIINQEDIDIVDSTYVKYAYVINTFSTEKNREKIINFLNQEGVYSIGRFGSYKYLNSDMCIKESLELFNTLKKSIWNDY